MEEITYYKLDDIVRNNGKTTDRTWILVKTDVYDVTHYMKDHPGGSELVEEYAGKDATSAFHEAGHSSDARKQLKALKIGELHPDERGNNVKKPTSKVKSENEPPSEKNRNFLDIISCGLCGRN
ncbi:cytochrome b5-like isoform X1 [Harmonia axyridis]|uniref:cytochrome b5-like isoform X1 n=1 Tax=Harmonia axyridis TaxID=115357 RepID=UPI001E277C56|nr:cytochrome b5-like isoform X1 [Harmonia axyridis]